MKFSRINLLVLCFGLNLLLASALVAQQTTASAALPAMSAGASASPAPTFTKIGVVNIQEAILESEEGKKEFDAVQKKFSPKQAELKLLSDEVENLKKQYTAQGEKLSEGERAARAKTIDSKQKALQRNYEDAQAEFQQAQQEIVNRIGARMLKVLEKYAQANSYSVVLDVSNPQTSPVLWATQGNVLTKELVDAYNAENPVAGAAKPAPAAKTPASAPRPSASATPKKP